MIASRKGNNVVRFFNKNRAVQNQHADHDTDAQCGNCGALIQGNFCHACGQSAHVHHSLLHLIEEMVHGLWHFDAKGWRTIPMLIAYPGELTRRYIDGQRVRFISPLGLFLFMVFFMFFAFSFSANHGVDSNNADTAKVKQEASKALNTEIANAKSNVVKAQTALDAAKKSGKDVDAEQEDLDSALISEKALETSLAVPGKVIDQAGTFAFDESHTRLNSNVVASIKKVLKHAQENPDLVAYKMKNNAYKFALILVPLSLPFLWILFIGRKNISMFDHAVFTLYSLSFMALFAAILSVLFNYDLSYIAVPLMFFIAPTHMFRQLKGTYQLSNLSALWRTVILCGVACLMVAIFIVFVATLSLT